ncbi:type II secretion system protein [Cerasicoccus frondis]|uniref:type II secretion system protein n=1 Tax=Cerasicoccus frondis TaxID=490090 RepID=UPI0028526452|nr:type II secretion system protein [Cerasicoccus frondis]
MNRFLLKISSTRKAFTLVELLAVVAIVGILSSIIIAVVGNVRQSADQTTCASNLRELQLASISYAAEQGYYVPSIINYEKGNGSIDRVYWYNNPIFLDHLGSEKQLRCPTHEYLKSDSPKAGNFSYGINFTNLEGGWSEPGIKRTATMVQVENPVDTMAFADGVDWQIADWAADKYVAEEYIAHAIAYRHNGKANIVRFDGSVSAMYREEVVKNNDLWKIEQ